MWINCMASLLAFLVLLVRVDVGYDYHSYIALFELGVEPREPISAGLFRLIKSYGTGSIYVMSWAVATWIFVLLTFTRRSVSKYGLFLFLTLPLFYLDAFSTMRQSTAVAICMYAYTLIHKRTYAPWLLSLCAVLVHYSAIVFLGFVALLALQRNFAKLNLRSVILGVFVSFALYLLYAYVSNAWVEIQAYFNYLLFYSGEFEFGEKLAAFALFLLLLGRGFSSLNMLEFRSSFAILVVVGSLALFDGVYTRGLVYGLIPLLFVRWKVLVRATDVTFPAITISGLMIFGITLYLKSQFDVGPLLPYRSFLW